MGLDLILSTISMWRRSLGLPDLTAGWTAECIGYCLRLLGNPSREKTEHG